MKIDLNFRDRNYVFETVPGLFSAERIDLGTMLLVENMEINDGDTVFDFGCGYGVIGIVAASLNPKGKIYMVDVDIRAVKQSLLNAELNHIKNVEIVASDGFAEILKDVKFDVILSNPPNHVAKEVLFEFVNQARTRLLENGKLYLVVEKRLVPMYKRLLTGLNVNEINKHGQYMVLKANT